MQSRTGKFARSRDLFDWDEDGDLIALKQRLLQTEQIGCVYQFTCPCSAEYIGETKRQLRTRILEHGRKIKKNPSKVYEHISTCPVYTYQLSQTLGESPTRNQRTTFLITFFKNLKTGITNYHNRKDLEAMYITINKPVLNEQVFHKAISIV